MRTTDATADLFVWDWTSLTMAWWRYLNAGVGVLAGVAAAIVGTMWIQEWVPYDVGRGWTVVTLTALFAAIALEIVGEWRANRFTPADTTTRGFPVLPPKDQR
jgi:hypothetical protein